MWFLQNHKGNYGTSRKPKNSTLMEQIFCQLQKIPALRIFHGFSAREIFFLAVSLFHSQETKILYEISEKCYQFFCKSGFD